MGDVGCLGIWIGGRGEECFELLPESVALDASEALDVWVPQLSVIMVVE